MRLISEIYQEAEQLAEGLGHGFLERLYSCEPVSAEFKEIKEGLQLGGFALRYNDCNKPKLIYAVRNPDHSGHADYTVFDDDRGLVCDLELTSVWERPKTWNEEPDNEDQAVRHVHIDEPARFPAYNHLKRNITRHLRTKYPQYWLIIYDNSSRAFRNLPWNEGATRIQGLIDRQKRRLPPNLQQVWVWDSSGFIKRVF